MICKQCEKSMIKGYIPTYSHKLNWYPEETKPTFFGLVEPKGGVQLTDTPIMGAVKLTAYLCRSCMTITHKVEQEVTE